MIHVLNLPDVIHMWANQRQDHARNKSNSISFDGVRLYSYTLLIGLVTQTATLIRERNSTVTTNDHISKARGAASHHNRVAVWSVPDTVDEPNRFREWVQKEVMQEIQYLRTEKEKISRARDRRPYYISDFERRTGEKQTLITFIRTQSAAVEMDAEQLAGVERLLEALEVEQTSPTDWADCKARKAEAVHQMAIETEKRQAQNLADWRYFKRNDSVYGTTYTYLRYNQATNTVETSKGIRIPAADAMRAIGAWRNGRLLGCELQGYRVTRIDTENQTVTAGCHTVPFAELEAIETLLAQAVAS